MYGQIIIKDHRQYLIKTIARESKKKLYFVLGHEIICKNTSKLI